MKQNGFVFQDHDIVTEMNENDHTRVFSSGEFKSNRDFLTTVVNQYSREKNRKVRISSRETI